MILWARLHTHYDALLASHTFPFITLMNNESRISLTIASLPCCPSCLSTSVRRNR